MFASEPVSAEAPRSIAEGVSEDAAHLHRIPIRDRRRVG